MPALKKKITSEQGASITFALLLFLVCAIISSVVIVAATAVGGRASKMAEMDQRYYAVNSAAELLRDELEGTEVKVTVETKTTSTVNQDLVEVETSIEKGTPTVKVSMNEVEDTLQESLFSVIALNLVDGIDDQPALPTNPLKIEAAASNALDTSKLAVNITPLLNVDKLILDISNAVVDSGVYMLRLTFKADLAQGEDLKTTYGTPIPVLDTDGSFTYTVDGKLAYTMEKTLTESNTTTIRWKLIDLVTAVANS